MKKVRIGFIVCGFHSTKELYPCLRYVTDRVDLVAVCDLEEDLVKRDAKWSDFERCMPTLNSF